jgi:hypothetical protein
MGNRQAENLDPRISSPHNHQVLKVQSCNTLSPESLEAY